jgi:hypothetical protein
MRRSIYATIELDGTVWTVWIERAELSETAISLHLVRDRTSGGRDQITIPLSDELSDALSNGPALAIETRLQYELRRALRARARDEGSAAPCRGGEQT